MTDYTPSVDTTIFPRINYLKTFSERLQARINNGRVAMYFNRSFTISGPTSVALIDGVTEVASYTANRTVDAWSLTGANAALFSIDSNGVVTSVAPTTAGSYVYVVNATTAGSPDATLTVNVVVTEVDVTAPTISGPTGVNVSTGDTAVATYTADESVTWSLTGANASLFSISAGGVVTFNSASVDGSYSYTVNGTDAAGNVGTLAVTVTVATTSGPAVTFDFAGTLSLDPRITFTRASTATYVDSSGLIQTAAADTARFTHDPTTLESKGLLIEGAATNYIPNSLCSNANAWGINGLVVTDNAGTAPDGTTTATFVTPETGNYTITSPLRTLPTDGEWTNSVFVKPDGMTEFTLNATSYGSTGNNSVVFDTTQSGVGGAGITPDAANNANYKRASMVHYPNGWVRISMTVNIVGPDLKGNWQLECTGDGTSSFYVWHWQQEQRNVNSFPSSLIPTNGAAVTRAADNADITGTNFSDWYNQSEGTLVVKYNRPTVAAGDNRIVTLLGASESVDRMSFMIRNNFTRLKLVGETNNVVFANTTMGGTDTSANPTFAYGYSSATDGHRITQQGITTTFTSAPPANTRLVIGYSTLTSESYLGGTVAKIEYYNTRLTDAEIDALT